MTRFALVLCALGRHDVVSDHDDHAWRWVCRRCGEVESEVPIDPQARVDYGVGPDVARKRS